MKAIRGISQGQIKNDGEEQYRHAS